MEDRSVKDNFSAEAPHMRDDAEASPDELSVVVACWVWCALLSLVVLIFLRLYR